MNESAPIRTAAVSFLNAQPLFRGLTDLGDRDTARLFEVQTCLPAECAQRLEEGKVDLGLVPVVELVRHPEWEVVPGIGIGCRGAVETVVLASDVPLAQVRSISLDQASRTSIVLLRLLLAQRGLHPKLSDTPHGTGATGIGHDQAALVIGDAAFGLSRRHEHSLDLGQAWFAETSLPFVFAVWAARPGVLKPKHVLALQSARDRMLERHLEAIAHEWFETHPPTGSLETPNHYANYLRKNIRYRLDTIELEGLVEFLERAAAADLVHGLGGARMEGNIHLTFVGEVEPISLHRSPRSAVNIDDILGRASRGERIDFAEGLALHDRADLVDLGRAADLRRQQLHPEGIVTYIVDRNVNYTNVCVTRCKFCNFYVPPGAREGAYVLSREQLAEKFRETEALGGIQILLQGGLNPDLRLDYYEDLFRWTKRNFKLALHALSPTEILHIAQLEDLSVAEVLTRLQAAGMDSLPGGGAEILDDEIRRRISPFKNSTKEWLDVMRAAHGLGMRSSATMVFGFQEHAEHVFRHFDRVRSLQDDTGGFTAFIAWPFQAEGTRLKLRDDTSPIRYLRIQALARLYLDNIPNIQVSWPTLGPDIGEVALHFGANDFGSVMIEENVVSKAGAHFMLDAKTIEDHIRWAGFRPQRRNMRYELLRE